MAHWCRADLPRRRHAPLQGARPRASADVAGSQAPEEGRGVAALRAHALASAPMQKLTFQVGDAATSALWLAPADAKAVYVSAHGAGAGMTHQSMTAIAVGLAERGIATLRYNFLYMERGSKRPDSPPLAHEAVRAAVAKAVDLAPKPPLF